jgi:hypothetical protein
VRCCGGSNLCSGVHARWDLTNSAGNPNISAVDFRAPEGYRAAQVAECGADVHAFARLIRTCQLKGSAKSPQMHRRNPSFEHSAVGKHVLTEYCRCYVRLGTRVYIRALRITPLRTACRLDCQLSADASRTPAVFLAVAAILYARRPNRQRHGRVRV